MKISEPLVAAVLAVAVGAPIGALLGGISVARPTTSTGVRVPFLHGFFNAQTTGQSELASLESANDWLNSPPLTASALRGKVVVVNFWTYTCINWLRTLPYVRAWHEKYKDQGLVVIGVHAPEFPFEHDLDNVRRAAKAMRVTYPIAIDNDFSIWRAFDNNYWPALYLLDGDGKIRFQHFGEGEYEQSERNIQRLLKGNGAHGVSSELSAVVPEGAEVAADWGNLKSPESYVGYGKAEGFASPGGATVDERRTYTAPARLNLNQWSLSGDWT